MMLIRCWHLREGWGWESATGLWPLTAQEPRVGAATCLWTSHSSSLLWEVGGGRDGTTSESPSNPGGLQVSNQSPKKKAACQSHLKRSQKIFGSGSLAWEVVAHRHHSRDINRVFQMLYLHRCTTHYADCQLWTICSFSQERSCLFANCTRWLWAARRQGVTQVSAQGSLLWPALDRFLKSQVKVSNECQVVRWWEGNQRQDLKRRTEMRRSWD